MKVVRQAFAPAAVGLCAIGVVVGVANAEPGARPSVDTPASRRQDPEGASLQSSLPTAPSSPTEVPTGLAPVAALPLRADNNEVFYGGVNSASMVSVSDGTLALSAARTKTGGYLSSQVESAYFRYGTITVRAQMPAGTGMWPAVWLLADGSAFGTPEIDMLELPQHPGTDLNVGHFTYHWTDASGTPWQLSTAVRFPFNLTTGMHTYQMVWRPTSITFRVDGRRVLDVDRSPSSSVGEFLENPGTPHARQATPSSVVIANSPMRLLIDNTVGSPGSWSGPPDRTTRFPNAIRVQSISIRSVSGKTLRAGGGLFDLVGD